MTVPHNYKEIKQALRNASENSEDVRHLLNKDNTFSGFGIVESIGDDNERFLLIEIGGHFSPISLKSLIKFQKEIPQMIKFLENQPRNKDIS